MELGRAAGEEAAAVATRARSVGIEGEEAEGKGGGVAEAQETWRWEQRRRPPGPRGPAGGPPLAAPSADAPPSPRPAPQPPSSPPPPRLPPMPPLPPLTTRLHHRHSPMSKACVFLALRFSLNSMLAPSTPRPVPLRYSSNLPALFVTRQHKLC